MATRKSSVEPGVTTSRSTATPWPNLAKIKIVPVKVRTCGYSPVHRVDLSSHTTIPPKPQTMIDNIKYGGGGFEVTFVAAQDAWAGWKEFQDKGIEMIDLRCEVCRQKVPVNPLHIREHFKVHMDQNKKRREGGTFLITLSHDQKPEESIEGAYEQLNYGNKIPVVEG